MKLSGFNYNLPKELIANHHIEPRDHSRLLVVDRNNKQIEHRHFYDILGYFQKGDILVFNNSRVFKARIYGNKETGGKVELLLIRPVGACPCGRPSSDWEALIRGKVKAGDGIFFENKLELEVIEKKERSCVVRFNKNTSNVFKYLEKYGEIPLPPYVARNPKSQIPMINQISNSKSQYPIFNITIFSNRKNKILQKDNFFYQTVYSKNVGSVAAPTAGFHFTHELIKKIKKKGVEILEITLHVGPGTFLPVESEKIEEHKMHEEFFEVKKEVWEKVLQAKADGRRIISVGTTTTRVLETLGKNQKSKIKSQNYRVPSGQIFKNVPKIPKSPKSPKNLNNPEFIIGSTDIFIYPPYRFEVIDALITNFHLPKSTLMMLVSAFLAPGKKTGVTLLKKLYLIAVKKKYRFYSFGDSMFIK
uniref:S-adenosylmethionine:tRNA ribosyltransferase-isomerase n=1 Tax=candidate division CPR3 bacterium TaxID=2268181 RepID=A0A7C4M115_UNCC3